MPQKAKASIEGQITELRKVAAKRLILVVLDGAYGVCADESHYLSLFCLDMWDTEHERPFSCIDPATASKLLVVCEIAVCY